jgi:hypothetical protein
MRRRAMYAVITAVSIGEGTTGSMERLREEIVPRVKQAPGFVAGYWAFDEAAMKGYSMVFFESEEQARTQLATVNQNMPEGPDVGITWELRTCGEVIAQAEK